jgi:hypothetical protein
MTSTALFTPPQASRPTEPWVDAHRDAHPVTPEEPTFGDVLDETVPLVDVIPVAGPPIVFILAPWLLLGLMLAGPFALLAVLVVALVAAWALVALIGAILASPFMLVRHLREHRASHAPTRAPASAPAPKLVPVELR